MEDLKVLVIDQLKDAVKNEQVELIHALTSLLSLLVAAENDSE